MSIERLKGKFIREDVGDLEPSEPKLDRNLTIKFSGRHRGSIRLSQGRYYTKEEWTKRRNKLQHLSLP
jgi:hypothetical protein